jgi:hypothetical protein
MNSCRQNGRLVEELWVLEVGARLGDGRVSRQTTEKDRRSKCGEVISKALGGSRSLGYIRGVEEFICEIYR